MISVTRWAILAVILLFSGILQVARAEEPSQEKDQSQEADIELETTEITELLNNIVGNFKLEEMEIVGNKDRLQLNSILRWQDPVPFPDEKGTLSRDLIDPFYIPLDSEKYRQMIDITIEEK